MDAYHLFDRNSNRIYDLSPVSRPWHEVVCVRGGKDSLPAAGIRFADRLRHRPGEPEQEPAKVEIRALPAHITQLLEYRRAVKERPKPQFDLRPPAPIAEAAPLPDFVPEGLAGVAVFVDCRDS